MQGMKAILILTGLLTLNFAVHAQVSEYYKNPFHAAYMTASKE